MTYIKNYKLSFWRTQSSHTFEKHFLSWVRSTAFPVPGLQTRAISRRHKGYNSQFFFLDPILQNIHNTNRLNTQMYFNIHI